MDDNNIDNSAHSAPPDPQEESFVARSQTHPGSYSRVESNDSYESNTLSRRKTVDASNLRSITSTQQPQQQLLRGVASAEKLTTVATSTKNEKEKSSSISSSSTGARRRKQEKERYGSSSNTTTDHEMSDYTIIGEIGGENFVQELQQQSRHNNRPSSSSSGEDVSDLPLKYKTKSTSSSYNSSGSGGGGGGVYRIDEQIPTIPPAASASGGRRAVLHACDDKGRCLFHPHIVLRKKAILGVMGGWKDVLPACPECESEDLAQQQQPSVKQQQRVKFDADPPGIDGSESSRYNSRRSSDGIDLSNSSRGGQGAVGTLRRPSNNDSPYEDDIEEGDEESSSEEESDYSSSGSSDYSSTSSSAEGHSPKLPQHQAYGSGETLPSRSTAREQRKNVSKSFVGGARKLNKFATGAGKQLKKSIKQASSATAAVNNKQPQPNDGDFISAYISSGVPSQQHQQHKIQPNSTQHQRNNPTKAQATQQRNHRPDAGPGRAGRVNKPASNRRVTDPVQYHAQTLRQNYSNDSGNSKQSLSEQQGKIKGAVSKGVSGLAKKAEMVKKGKAKLSNSFTSSAGTPSFNPADLLNHSDNSLVDDDDYEMMYGAPKQNDYFGDIEREKRSQAKQQNSSAYPPSKQQGSSTTRRRRTHDVREPYGASLHYDGIRVRTVGKDPVDDRVAQADSSAKKRSRWVRGPTKKVISPTKIVGAVPTILPHSPDVAYQWDRMPLPPDKYTDKSSKESQITAEETVLSEDDSHDQGLATAAAYQWDRMPLPETSAAVPDRMSYSDTDKEWTPQNIYGRNQQPSFPWHAAERNMAKSLPLSSLNPSNSNSQHNHETDSVSVADSVVTIITAEERKQQNARRKKSLDSLVPPNPPPRSFHDSDNNISVADSAITILNADDPQSPRSAVNNRRGHNDSDSVLTILEPQQTLRGSSSQLRSPHHDSDSVLTILEPQQPSRGGNSHFKSPHHDSDSVLTILNTEETASSQFRSPHHDSDSVLTLLTAGEDVPDRLPSETSTNGVGLLSMQDLLQSIQEDVHTMGLVDFSGSESESEYSLPQNGKETSLPQQFEGSSPENSNSNDSPRNIDQEDATNNDSGFSNDYLSKALVDGLEDDKRAKLKTEASLKSISVFSNSAAASEADSESDDESTAQSLQQDGGPALSSAEPIPLSQLGTYGGGLKIDFSALGLSSLQASKPSPKKPEEEKTEEKKVQPEPEPEPFVPEKPVIKDLKTFQTTNLPFTGSLGESGMYTGSVSEMYEPHGKGTMVYDNGEVVRGYWNEGDLVRESELYSDDDDDDDEDEDDEEEEDLSSSMANVGAKSRDRSRSRSRSKDRVAQAPPPKPKSPSPPPLPEYEIGDPGKHRDMIIDKEEALLIIEQLQFGDGA